MIDNGMIIHSSRTIRVQKSGSSACLFNVILYVSCVIGSGCLKDFEIVVGLIVRSRKA